MLKRRDSASQRLVGAVAEWLAAGVLAGAEEFARRFIGRPFDRREFAALVAAVAERLVLGAPAGAPPVILAGLDHDRNGLFLGDIGYRHRMSSLVAMIFIARPHLPSSTRPRSSLWRARARAGYRPGAR